jgi:hypothetical protein
VIVHLASLADVDSFPLGLLLELGDYVVSTSLITSVGVGRDHGGLSTRLLV